ncbi:MAG TPA: hypothetical protein VEG27_13725 [Usitatibacter sp.]|nr:hypothetical protein [Usitatibacter sp.]
MSPPHGGRRRCWPLVLLVAATGVARAADEYSFDASQYEKKPYEFGGYVQLEQDAFTLNRSGALYKLGYYGEPQRSDLDQTLGILELTGKLRHGIASFDFRTYSSAQTNELASDHTNLLYEGAFSLRPNAGVTLEAGKRALSWGKGYAWNPIGFVQRPKDPNDPQLAREGYVMADGDFIRNPGGALQTLALTPVVVPVSSRVNGDFGSTGHANPAFKLYALYRDTDLDFAWQGKGSRPARFGFDFAHNLKTNFEVHGEWARILQFPKLVTDASGHASTEVLNATSYLLGLRYLTQGNATCIAELYHNGAGYSRSESDSFYRLVDAAFAQAPAPSMLLQRALALGDGPYARPFAGRNYAYFRVQQQDALGIVYFQPALFALANLDDGSFQVTPELDYTGFKNLELRFRVYMLHGGELTDFGEKQNTRKVELYARLYF